MASVSVRNYNLIDIPVDIREELIRYCELKQMDLPTADVFRRTKQNYGDMVITRDPSFSFNNMQEYFEKTRITPYKDLINVLKQC